MGRFCPICGKENTNFIEGLCEECYRRLNPLVKELPKEDQLTFKLCTNCGSILYKGRWTRKIDLLKKHIQELIKTRGHITKIEIGYIPTEPGEFEVPIRVCGKVHEKIQNEYCEDYSIRIRILPEVCPTCRTIILGKEKALVQVRYVGDKYTQEDLLLIKHIVNQVLAKSDEVQRGAVIDIEEVENGFNIKVTSNTIARAIATAIHRAFPSKMSESHKLVGMDRSGRPITRLTISIHILNVKKGDVIQIDGRDAYYILAISKDSVHVKDLKRCINTRISVNELFKRKIGKLNLKTEYCQVSSRDGRTLIKCEDREFEYNRYLPEGVKVKVVWYEDRPVVIEEEIIPA